MTDKIVTDRQTETDKKFSPPGACNNRGRILQILWQAPTMRGTLHRKIQNPSFISFCLIGIFQNRDRQTDKQTNRQTDCQTDNTNI